MTTAPREFHVCPVCSREAPTHRDETHRRVFSRHAWFLTEGRDLGSSGRCPGSLAVLELPAADEPVLAVTRSPRQGGHL